MHPIGWAAIATGGILLLKKLFAHEKPVAAQVVDCSKAMQEYYDVKVRLTRAEQKRLAAHRDANRERIRQGLKRRLGPAPLEFIPQGSYAMDTIILEPDHGYDIDDGVVFDSRQLIGPRGAAFSALEARRLVLDCLDDDSRISPELRTNCVRIPYAKGYHVDVPVYRATSAPDGTRLEHAGSEWQPADPRGVTGWFQQAVEAKSPDQTNGRQMRRVVRLVKKMFATRKSWNTPSGFILSRLVDEVYEPYPGRDDAALYSVLVKTRHRLGRTLEVAHPVLPRDLTRGSEDPRMLVLRDALDDLLTALHPVTETSTSLHAALTAWRVAFNDDYFTFLRDATTEKPRGRQ